MRIAHLDSIKREYKFLLSSSAELKYYMKIGLGPFNSHDCSSSSIIVKQEVVLELREQQETDPRGSAMGMHSFKLTFD